MQRNSSIDIAKGVGIFLVIIGHQGDLPVLSHFIYSFHMPLFFLFAGYFYKSVAIKNDVLKNIKRLIVPYFFVGAMYLVWYIAFGIKYQSVDMPLRAVKALLFGSGAYHGDVIWSEFPTIGMIWFLLALFWCRFIYNFMTRLIPRYKYIAGGIISITATLIDNYIINLPLAILPGLSAIMFYLIGNLFREKQDTLLQYKKQIIPIGLICWGMAIMYSGTCMVNCRYGFYPGDIIAGCAGTYIVYKSATIINKWNSTISFFLAWAGVNSMTILCAHFLEQSTFVWQLLHIPEDWYVILPIKFVYVIVFTLVAYRIPFVRKILMVSKFER